MTVKGGTSHACAACKYQRRKCSADCPLAPYFPPDQPKMFQNAHRLFGVRNILNILKPLDPSQKMEAMRSIVYESNIRARYPVGGCHSIIWQLHYQLQQAQLELQLVNTQLAMYRQNQNHSPLPPSQLQLGNSTTTPPTAATNSPNNTLSLFQQHQPFDAGMSLQSFSNENHAPYSNGVTPDYMIPKDDMVNPLWMQHAYNNTTNNNSNNNTMAIQSQMFDEQPISFQQEADEAPQDYDEMPAFFDTIDDRQSYIDSKEGYESSPESSLRDTTQSIEHVSENELKSAAACFSLTSVN